MTGTESLTRRDFPPRSECRGFARRNLLNSADRFDEASQHETAAMLRYAADDLKAQDTIEWQRGQPFLYDQWGLRIAHCENTEPHKWHGWVGANTDLRCPGVPDRG